MQKRKYASSLGSTSNASSSPKSSPETSPQHSRWSEVLPILAFPSTHITSNHPKTKKLQFTIKWPQYIAVVWPFEEYHQRLWHQMTNHKTMYFKWQKPFFRPIYSLSHRHITSHRSNNYCSCSQFQSFLAPASVEWSSQVDDPQILRSNVQIYLPTTDFNFKIIRFIA